MFKKTIFILTCLIFLAGGIYPPLLTSPEIDDMGVFKDKERILIIAPHPDDEALACAGIIQQAQDFAAQVRIVYLTNGDQNQLSFIAYKKRPALLRGSFMRLGQLRKEEAIKAMELLGLDKQSLIFLGYPDLGTFKIFTQHWQANKPLRSFLGQCSLVPYRESISFTAPYDGKSILEDFKKILLEYKPSRIFISHPADQNPDHVAAYLFLQIALSDLEQEITKPKLYPYLVHAKNWPLADYKPQLSLEPPEGFFGSEVDWSEFRLSQKQIDKKHRALSCYGSQMRYDTAHLLSFLRRNELFGEFSEISLAKTGKASIANQQVSFSLADGYLLISLKRPKELKQRLRLIFYLLGYSRSNSFALMPKIRIVTKYNKFSVYDAQKKIKPEGIKLEFDADKLSLKVPLKILGYPDYILSSIKPSGVKNPDEIIAIEAMGFRKLNLK